MSKVQDLMALASFLVSNQGIKISEAALATGRDVQALLKDCDKLMMCGVPPYTPTDLIRVSIEGSGDDARIQVSSADYLANPIAFTPHETLALDWVLRHYRHSADSETRKQLDGLMQTFQESLHGRAKDVQTGRSAFVVPKQTARQRELIAEMVSAAEDQVIVEIEYYSAHKARLSNRKVHPYGVSEIGGFFYLYALCETVGETRHFRMDRVRNATILDEDFSEKPPKTRSLGRMESMFTGKSLGQMKVKINAEIARDVCHEWGSSPGAKVHWLKNGSARLTLPLYNTNWAIGFLIGLGKKAKLEYPTWLRDELISTIEQSI